MRKVLRFFSYTLPPTHTHTHAHATQTCYFDTELRILGFPTSWPSLLGTWSLVDNISTWVFKRSARPRRSRLAPACLLNAPHPPHSGCRATGRAPWPGTLGHYFLVWVFFSQREHHHPPLEVASRKGPLRSAEALRGLPSWWKRFSDVLKRIPNGASGPRAVPSKCRCGPWLSEPRNPRPAWRGS